MIACSTANQTIDGSWVSLITRFRQGWRYYAASGLVDDDLGLRRGDDETAAHNGNRDSSILIAGVPMLQGCNDLAIAPYRRATIRIIRR